MTDELKKDPEYEWEEHPQHEWETSYDSVALAKHVWKFMKMGDAAFFNIDSFRHRWRLIGLDPDRGHFHHRWIGTWYSSYLVRPFDKWVGLWQDYISSYGKVTEDEELTPRLRQIFTNLNTDKTVLISQASDTNAVYRLPSTNTNPITRNTLFRQAIMLAVFQQACIKGFQSWGMGIPRDIGNHPLFSAYAIPWDEIFMTVYNRGHDNSPQQISDKQFKEWDIAHLDAMVQRYMGWSKSSEETPTYSKPSMLVKDFEGADWSDVHLQVEVVGVVQAGGWAIKIKRKGQKTFKTYELHELGLATKDERVRGKLIKGEPLVMFNTLKMLAECAGFYTPTAMRKGEKNYIQKRDKLKKRIGHLRAHFGKIFGITDGNPIKYKRENKIGSWIVQFAECVIIDRDVETPHPSDNEMLDPAGYTAPTSGNDALHFQLNDSDKLLIQRAKEGDSNAMDELSFRDKDELE